MTLQEIDKKWSDAQRQQKQLIEYYNNSTPIDLTVIKEATDELPTVELESDCYSNWKFLLNRRFCVAGFLHQLKVGMSIQLYIQNFGNSQHIFCSYFKKDNLDENARQEIINELKNSIKEDLKEQIKQSCESAPLEVRIETVLRDHIIVEYKGLYGTITNADLFHADSAEDMEYYRQLSTMKVYLNSIDETGNVRFSETRLPELINNSNYKGNEKTERKWINNACISEFRIGQEIEGIIWQHMKNTGVFAICKNNSGEFMQCLIPISALSKWEFFEWKGILPIRETKRLKILNINQEEKKLTLALPEVDHLKFKEEVLFERQSDLNVNTNLLNEGDSVDIILMAVRKENDNILCARTDILNGNGDKHIGGYINIEEDIPETLSHSSGFNKHEKKKRNILNGIISYKRVNEKAVQHIKLPAITHIKDGHYWFSIMDSINKCIIDGLPESDFKGKFKARKEVVEVVYSWKSSIKGADFIVLRWKNLFSFMHINNDEKIMLTRGEEFYCGMKVNIWIKGINRDLSFDADAYNPYLSWTALDIKEGDLVSAQDYWLNSSGKLEIYKTKILGCSAFIMPGFEPDDDWQAYNLKVVYIDKASKILILDYNLNNNKTFISKGDIIPESSDVTNDNKDLNLICPLTDNSFLMTYEGKYCVMESSTAGVVLIQAIYNHFLLENETIRSTAYFKCEPKYSFSKELHFEWTGTFRYSTYTWNLDILISQDINKNVITLKHQVNTGYFKPFKNYDLTCYIPDFTRLRKEDKVRFTGKYIIKKSVQIPWKEGKQDIIYPIFVDNNSRIVNREQRVAQTFRRNQTNYKILDDNHQYSAMISNLYRGELKIVVNENQFTYYYINIDNIKYWLFSKTEVDFLKEHNNLLVNCSIKTKKDKYGNERNSTSLSRVLTETQQRYRKELEYSRNSEVVYLFQVIIRFPEVLNQAIPFYGGFAGYIFNTDIYNKKDAFVEILKNDTRTIPFENISENDIFPVYYHRAKECFSIVPSKDFILKKYREMRFKAKIIRQEKERIILESGGKDYYAYINNDFNRKSLLNQFGLLIVPNKSVYISPSENNQVWPEGNSEVYIIPDPVYDGR